MTGLTTATIRTQARRYVGPGLAVVLGVAFVAATLVLGATFTASVQKAVSGDLGSYAVVVDPPETTPDPLTDADLARVRTLPGVASVAAERRGFIAPASGTDVYLVSTPPAADGVIRLTAGRMPTRTGEVAMAAPTAAGLDLGVGGRFTTANGSATVVGLVDATGDASTNGLGAVYATPEEVTALTGTTGWSMLRVTATSGASPQDVADAATIALGSHARVRTGEEAAKASVDELTNGTDVLTGMLLAFAAIALLVSAIVIANTFSVLLARRARETALLRAVGATRGQVLRSALVEALALGVLASLAGVAFGAVVARGLTAAAGAADLPIPLTAFTVPPTAVLVPVAVGLLVTVAAALVPVLRSARVSPMAALRPDLAVRVRSRAGLVRLGLGGLAILGGGALLGLGAFGGVLVAGIAGGALSFLGVLLAGSVLVPPLARAIGALPARAAGVPGEMAVENTVRQPARTAATASALLVGVTLIVMMSVGAATGQRSAAAALDDEFSVDLAATVASGPVEPGATVDPASARGRTIPADVVTALSHVPGVVASASLPGATATVGTAEGVAVYGTATGVDAAVRGDALDRSRPGVLVVSSDGARAAGLRDGQRTTVTVGSSSRALTVVVADHAFTEFVLDGADLRALDPSATTRATLLRLSPTADVSTAVAMAQKAIRGTDVSIGGGAPQRAELDDVIDTVLAVVTALLAVSVVIAVVGIGTALSLSVIERTRELALLRALGLTRGQLRGMLASESVLLAVVAAVLGTGLGVLYGVAGPMSVLGDTAPVLVDVPWGRIGMVALAAVVCGLGASVLPARRATRIAPATALADD